MFLVTAGIGIFGLIMAPTFTAGTTGAVVTMALGLALMGFTYGPLGTVVSELFPTAVRYTGSSLAFNFAGILGASLAPYMKQLPQRWLLPFRYPLTILAAALSRSTAT